MRMAMVIRVQHLVQMSAALKLRVGVIPVMRLSGYTANKMNHIITCSSS